MGIWGANVGVHADGVVKFYVASFVIGTIIGTFSGIGIIKENYEKKIINIYK